jgi:hypothetical protein
MKYINLNTLSLMFVFHTSCGGQSQTNPPQDNFSKGHNGYSESQLKELATSKVPMSQVRNVKQDRNGNILIAATWGGVFRYDARLNDSVGQGKSFTNITRKINSPSLAEFRTYL